MKVEKDFLNELEQAVNIQDYGRAFSLCTHAKIEDELNWNNSRFYLGWMYEFGLWVEKNYDMAAVYYNEAARNRDCRAQFRLGVISAKTGDFENAFKFYQLASEADYPPGIFRVAYYYEKGRVVSKSTSSATALYKKAMNMGHVFATRNYGLLMLRQFNVCGFYYLFKGIFIYYYQLIKNPRSSSLEL